MKVSGAGMGSPELCANGGGYGGTDDHDWEASTTMLVESPVTKMKMMTSMMVIDRQSGERERKSVIERWRNERVLMSKNMVVNWSNDLI